MITLKATCPVRLCCATDCAAEMRRLLRPFAGVGILILGFLFACSARAQISPGPLSRAHQSLNGDTNCIKCHEVSTRAPSFKCLECHREIAAEVKENRGLHATFPRSGPPGAACVKCHSDHNGIDFLMVRWDPTPRGFDHTKTGFLLDGKHMGVSCRACHSEQHVSAQRRALLPGKDFNRTWFGLAGNCATCHQDAHQGRFGADCARCHSTSDWKAATVSKEGFDHSTTHYPLTGKHRSTLCASCHTPNLNGELRYSGIAFEYCSDCHRDPHRGEFKQRCDSCHTTSTWKKPNFSTVFDHSKTNYPLRGKHLQVPCESCHQRVDFKSPIAHDQCTDCHKQDPHGGQFLQRDDGGRCDSCHTVLGWSPTTFTLADHAKTRYPIVFPHTEVKCAACHIPSGKNTRFKIKFARCVDCHEDEHMGQFAAAPWSNQCAECHAGATFKTTSYTLAKHQKASFPLTGGHEAVACDECHKPSGSTKVTLYHFNQLACTSCHQDVHKGEFAKRMEASDRSGKLIGCEVCHSTRDWKDLAKFDHASTGFPLLGAHRAVVCSACHKPPNLELTMVHVRFDSAPQRCAECHENPHADQFGVQASNCASCHNSNKWRPSLFDHEMGGFPLKGGHQRVACSACHTLKKEVNGKVVLFYKPTTKGCADCHGTHVPQST